MFSALFRSFCQRLKYISPPVMKTRQSDFLEKIRLPPEPKTPFSPKHSFRINDFQDFFKTCRTIVRTLIHLIK
ncbi:Uncharacterized protein dnm_008900 [Desulfonema magnum]|uniref:Uncharacterized protein n=1 Tax=Desulfonema magnum TaxID=45655 RepID=A0A975BGB4_9BACT|nr:Uncharacterized protein dnm_008900 [Desulfonema magnum]